jgi:hypothetical protein
MISEVNFGASEWKHAKKQLEENGHRHENYWARKAVISADELRKHAMSGKIDAMRVWIGGTPKLYYTIESVKAALKLLGR